MTTNLRVELVGDLGAKIYNGKKFIGTWYRHTGEVIANIAGNHTEVVGWAHTPEEVLKRLYRGCVYVWKMKEKG